MATILLVEDGATVSRQVTALLEAAGHRVVHCGGGPTPLAACWLLRYGRCAFVDNADLLVFACTLTQPLPGRSYRGIHLLRALRTHPDYGRLPLVLVGVGAPQSLPRAGPTEVVETQTDPAAVVSAVNRLLQPTGQAADNEGDGGTMTGRLAALGGAPIVGALVDLNHSAHTIHRGWFLISVANLVVIALMIAVFVLAIVLPFPGRRR
jgi:CheY-like chemotaxis protein